MAGNITTAAPTPFTQSEQASLISNGAIGLAAKGELTPEMEAKVESSLNELIQRSSSSALGIEAPTKTAPKVEAKPTADTASVILTNYASKTGNHITPDGTLDLPGIKGDYYSANPEIRKAASDLLAAGATVSTRSATAVTAPVILTDYASKTGNHIKPDGTLDLPRIKGDYSATPEVRKAASDSLDAGATVSTRDATPVKPTKTVTLKSAETVAVKPADAKGDAAAAKAAMNANLDKLADHISGSSNLSKEDFQKIADGNYSPLDKDIELNAADFPKLKAAAKHLTENFDKFDTAYEGKDANSRVSALDIRAITDPKKTADAINASNTLLGKDASVADDKKVVVKENLSVLANHLSGNSSSSLEDFKKIADGDFSPLDHDISISDADIAKIQAGAKYVTKNFDNFDTAQSGRLSNGGVSPDNIRGYTDTNITEFTRVAQTEYASAFSS